MFPDMTIAALERDRITHAEYECCGSRVMVPWRMLGAAPDETFDDVVERLVCRRCGGKPNPGTVRPWGQWMCEGWVDTPC
ncbi:hypothetical protein SLNSH_02810 [Alsobacter soli]|uniref:Uncharacterized protein n=1 Tax=Alsobacter soli TaxID=2109933 RepID=A0A2T1HYQ8_9HYPH|nr:hypothetical protein [Alsobacter soli]PSC06744.1 hypothetical protein SLNSH_02810 [Alsobacter soli]